MSQQSPFANAYHYSPGRDMASLKIGIATARWNSDITDELERGAIETLEKAGLKPEQLLLRKVPGSFELPLAAQKLIAAGADAVICIGCVIQGDTAHFDYVCQATTSGIMDVGLKHNRPVIFGLLTVHSLQQAMDRIGGSQGHKGVEAALTALEMLEQ